VTRYHFWWLVTNATLDQFRAHLRRALAT